MSKNIVHILLFAAVLAAGCAKEVTYGPNDANKRFIEAWMHVNNPGIKPTGLGIYVLDESQGEGTKTVTENGYAIVDYTVRTLNGEITSYTTEETARKLGTYDTTAYYGPRTWLTTDGTIQAGLQEALTGMKVGGSKTVVIPSWLMSYSTYATGAEYLNNETDYPHTIYEFTVRDFTDSIDVWQIDSIERYITKNYGSLESFSNDTTGFYYRQTSAPTSDKSFPSDTTIYINYTGRLLNGLVFDTNIEKVAKDHNLYSASKEYEPSAIKWGASYSDITMGSSSSSVINGFALTLWQMKAMEKGTGIFYSPLGYGYSGSGASIPAYAPLIFEIEIVDKPED